MTPIQTLNCDASPGTVRLPGDLQAMVLADASGYTPDGHDPYMMARHQGLKAATKNNLSIFLKRFRQNGPFIRRRAEPIFIDRSMLESWLYRHDDTHGLQFYFGMAIQIDGADVTSWDLIEPDQPRPRPLLDFRLLVVPAKYGYEFSHDTITTQSRGCHRLLWPGNGFKPITSGGPYGWQPATADDCRQLKASQALLWPLSTGLERPSSYFVGRHRLYHDVLQQKNLLRIDPLIYLEAGVSKLGLVMAGVNSTNSPRPTPNGNADGPGEEPKPNVFWTIEDGGATGSYCTLPSPPRTSTDEVV